MGKRFTARQLAEAAGILGSVKLGDAFSVQYQKGGRVHVLTKIRFGPTKRMMECLENGEPRAYDKDYAFEVTAFFVNGNRFDF